jgi:hypothetical protein
MHWRGEKNAHGGGWVLFLEIFGVFFVFRQIFVGVFELPVQKIAQKRNKRV